MSLQLFAGLRRLAALGAVAVTAAWSHAAAQETDLASQPAPAQAAAVEVEEVVVQVAPASGDVAPEAGQQFVVRLRQSPQVVFARAPDGGIAHGAVWAYVVSEPVAAQTPHMVVTRLPRHGQGALVARLPTPLPPHVAFVARLQQPPQGADEAYQRALEAQAEAAAALKLAQAAAAQAQKQEEQVRLGDYWIGLGCRPGELDPTLRAQLALPEDRGLIVEHVVEEGPAAKAGLQGHDILLSAGDAALASIQDLVDAVEAAGKAGQEMTVEIVRGGQKMTLTVAPAQRPAEYAAPPPDADAFFPGLPGAPGDPYRLFVPQPGVVLPPGKIAVPQVFEGHTAFAFVGAAKLPDGVTVTATQTGGEPMRITVTRGDEKWEVAPDTLDQLPEDLRGPVGVFIGRPQAIRFQATPAEPFGAAQQGVRAWIEAAPWQGQAPPGIEARLQEIQARLAELTAAVEELKQQAAHDLE